MGFAILLPGVQGVVVLTAEADVVVVDAVVVVDDEVEEVDVVVESVTGKKIAGRFTVGGDALQSQTPL